MKYNIFVLKKITERCLKKTLHVLHLKLISVSWGSPSSLVKDKSRSKRYCEIFVFCTFFSIINGFSIVFWGQRIFASTHLYLCYFKILHTACSIDLWFERVLLACRAVYCYFFKYEHSRNQGPIHFSSHLFLKWRVLSVQRWRHQPTVCRAPE
jgi:hypothetical protein